MSRPDNTVEGLNVVQACSRHDTCIPFFLGERLLIVSIFHVGVEPGSLGTFCPCVRVVQSVKCYQYELTYPCLRKVEKKKVSKNKPQNHFEVFE